VRAIRIQALAESLRRLCAGGEGEKQGNDGENADHIVGDDVI